MNPQTVGIGKNKNLLDRKDAKGDLPILHKSLETCLEKKIYGKH